MIIIINSRFVSGDPTGAPRDATPPCFCQIAEPHIQIVTLLFFKHEF